MSEHENEISLQLFEELLEHGLSADGQALLTQAIKRLQDDVKSFGITVRNKPVCSHQLTDDGLFTVACSECGVVVDATPHTPLIDGLVQEVFEACENEDGECSLDEETLTQLLFRAASESIVQYALAPPTKK